MRRIFGGYADSLEIRQDLEILLENEHEIFREFIEDCFNDFMAEKEILQKQRTYRNPRKKNKIL